MTDPDRHARSAEAAKEEDCANPRRWLLRNQRLFWLDEECIISMDEGPVEASLCTAYLLSLAAQNPHEPIRLGVHSGLQVTSWLITLCNYIAKGIVGADVYTFGSVALGGTPLVVASGKKGRRFVQSGERYELCLAKLPKAVVPEDDTNRDEFNEDSDDGEIEDVVTEKLASVDQAESIVSNNARFIRLMRKVCGKKVLPLVKRMECGENIPLSADQMIRYGLADHCLTAKNRHLFFGQPKAGPRRSA